MKGIITTKTWSGLVHHFEMPSGMRETIEAKIISEIPLPIPRWVISSPIHISIVQPAVSVIDDQEQLREGPLCRSTFWPCLAS